MSAANERKIVLVTRRTRLEDLIAKYLTADQARFYVEHLGADFSDYQREHDVYQEEQHRVLQTLELPETGTCLRHHHGNILPRRWCR